MKRRYLVVGSLAFLQFFAKAQPPADTAGGKLNRTDIELVYNHYLQDGNHSAITGGTGTEKLRVYGPALNWKSSFGKNALSFNLGTDIITSASSDKIDFVVSSASKRDTRAYINGNYARQSAKRNLIINGGLGFSMESVYLSLSGEAGFVKKDKNNLRSFSAQFQFFDDDLRWGRLSRDYGRPVRLVYPVELRYREWYDEYRRYSSNLKMGFTQVLNRRNTLGIFPEFSYQQGLLATPYHRIFFSDGTEAVENLPDDRYKGSLALKLNTFAGGNLIFKNTINGYTDSFGIRSVSLENETAIKVKPFLTLLPNFRVYSQQGSVYFARYGVHRSSEKFYTSDFDLSSFQSFDPGFGIKYHPQKFVAKRFQFNSVTFRYNYYYRNNGLKAHILSVVFQASRTGKKNR